MAKKANVAGFWAAGLEPNVENAGFGQKIVKLSGTKQGYLL